jgi:hypothetical protein
MLRFSTARGSLLPQIHDQQSGFGHFFDRIAQSFAAEAGVFYSTVRHLVDAERRNIARD